MKVLVTGANGFIGSHVLEALIKENGWEIAITLRPESDISRIRNMLEESNRIKAYVLGEQSLDSIISSFKPDLVVNFAVYYEKKDLYSNIDQMVETNISFSSKILDSMSRNGGRFFVNTGTYTEFLMDKQILATESNVHPANLYSATKAAFENILKYYTENYNITAVTLNLSTTYGPKDKPNNLIPYLVNCSLENRDANVSAGEQILDFVYVKDVAEAYVKAMRYLLGTHKNYDVFSIGSGSPHNLKEIAEIISGFGGNLRINWGAIPYSLQETFFFKSDITHARNVLRWWPKYTLSEGLRETFEYFKGVKSHE